MTTKAAAKTTEKSPRKLPTAGENAVAEANQQAEAYDSLFSPTPLELDGGDVIMIPLHPDYSMLDDERMDEWDEFMFTVDTVYEREPDIHIPEQELENGLRLPATEQRGNLLRPFRIKDEDGNSKLVKPAHSVKIVQVALGEAEYKRLRDGGRNAADVWRIWSEQGLRIRSRQAGDPKSTGSSVAVAPVPTPDS